MDREIAQSLIRFFNDKDINFSQVSENYYRLDSESFDHLNITTYLGFSDRIEAIVDANDKRFQGLSQWVIENCELKGRYKYNKSGAFSFEIEGRTVDRILEELSMKTFELVEILKSDEVNERINQDKVKLRNFRTGNCFYNLNKENYLQIYDVGDCIWLGNIQIFIDMADNSDLMSVRCFIENEKTKKLKEIISGKIDAGINSINSLIQELNLKLHDYFLVKKDIYEFFADPVQGWKDFYFKYADVRTNMKVFKVYLSDPKTDEQEIEVSNEKSEIAPELLPLLSNHTRFHFNKLVSKQD